MRHRVIALLVGVLGAGLILFASPVAAEGLDSLKWLEGSWKRESPNGVVSYESWQRVSERTMEGRGWRVGPEGASRETESMLLARMGTELFYIPKPPQNEHPVAFKLIEVSSSRVLFENPGHDFPQRIGYERNEDGSMTAWIEGDDEAGKPQRVDFPFERAAK